MFLISLQWVFKSASYTCDTDHNGKIYTIDFLKPAWRAPDTSTVRVARKSWDTIKRKWDVLGGFYMSLTFQSVSETRTEKFRVLFINVCDFFYVFCSLTSLYQTICACFFVGYLSYFLRVIPALRNVFFLTLFLTIWKYVRICSILSDIAGIYCTRHIL